MRTIKAFNLSPLHVEEDFGFLKQFHDEAVTLRGGSGGPAQAEQLFMVTVDLNIPVICYGLRSDFSLKGFPGSTRLLELAHTIEEMKTICTCGRKAICNCRKVNGQFVFEGEQVAIDLENDVQYVSMCPQCYFRERRAFYARRAAK